MISADHIHNLKTNFTLKKVHYFQSMEKVLY